MGDAGFFSKWKAACDPEFTKIWLWSLSTIDYGRGPKKVMSICFCTQGVRLMVRLGGYPHLWGGRGCWQPASGTVCSYPEVVGKRTLNGIISMRLDAKNPGCLQPRFFYPPKPYPEKTEENIINHNKPHCIPSDTLWQQVFIYKSPVLGSYSNIIGRASNSRHRHSWTLFRGVMECGPESYSPLHTLIVEWALFFNIDLLAFLPFEQLQLL